MMNKRTTYIQTYLQGTHKDRLDAHQERLDTFRKERLQRMKEIREKATSRRTKILQQAPLPVSKEGAFIFAVMVAVMAIMNDEI